MAGVNISHICMQRRSHCVELWTAPNGKLMRENQELNEIIILIEFDCDES